MADAQTMQAYADNIAAYKTLVDGMPSNPHLERFITYLPAGAAVLDFGCGVGNSAALMRDAGFAMTCMDASSDMISAAKELYDLEVLQRNFTDLEDIASFDGIWASYSLLHAPKSDMPDILQRIHAALRASGMVYVGLKRGDAEERDDIGRFYAYYTETALQTLLRDAGFDILDSRTDESRGMLGRMDKGLHIMARKRTG